MRTDFASTAGGAEPARPLVMGQRAVVSTGHYLATAAGDHMYSRRGSAIDAGIAAGVAVGVLLFERVNFAGVAPIALHHARSGDTVTIDGLGVWPKMTDPAVLAAQDGLGDNILRAVTPAAPDAWLTALSRYGTLTAAEVLEPAWEYAARGVPISHRVAHYLNNVTEVSPWPVDMNFFPDAQLPRAGQVFARPELAKVIKSMMDADVRARQSGCSREAAIQAARDVFYRGWVAEEIDTYHRAHGGWMRFEDLAAYSVEIAPPLRGTYRDFEVLVCGPWCQGPALVQALNILETFDLEALGHNSTEYMHILAESVNLAFADRENFYGDPRFVDVPLDTLLSKAHARTRALEINRGKAFGTMPSSLPLGREMVDVDRYRSAPDALSHGDTSYVAAVDSEGNVFSATPSDSEFWGPVVPNLGFSVSGRGIQSRFDQNHPSSAVAGKRPRLTPNPAMLSRDGIPFMAIGCPGGDAQVQGMVQTLLNMIDFGMQVQEAIEAPRVTSWNFPNSFAPHPYHAGRLDVESRIGEDKRNELARLGHTVRVVADYADSSSAVHAAVINPDNGVLLAGSDPRSEGAATARVS